MSRINTNVSSITAQISLANNQVSLSTTLRRLSTGLKINSGADDPAGLIASQSLQSQMAGINQAVSNSQRATNVLSTADAALNEVSNLLDSIKALVVASANTGAESTAEISANQLQVDSAVQSITRIANTTTFDGMNLINGSLDYITSGVSASAIASVQISQADFGTSPTIPVSLNVITSAQTAGLQFRGSAIASSVTLQITGNTGVQTLSFTSGTKSSAIAFAVNSISDTTGVTAALINPANAASGVAFHSSGYGSSNFVSVAAQSGTFATVDVAGASEQRVVGRDAVATVNGAVVHGSGLNLDVNTGSLNMNLTLSSKFGDGKSTFTITGGGALFQLGGVVSSSQQVDLGIGSVAASQLGNSDVGFLNDIVTGGRASLVGGKAGTAGQILEAAITQVAELRGRLGAFEKNTLNTTGIIIMTLA